MSEYLTFEVEIIGIEPRIWRRFMLAGTSTFLELHEAIQRAFGWKNIHLFAFRESERGSEIIGSHGTGAAERKALGLPVSTYFKPAQANSCVYVYDFGESWMHRVTLVERSTLTDEFSRRLLGGDRAGPLEDLGGVRGYERCVQVLVRTSLTTKISDQDLERLQLIGDWRPDDFDLEVARKEFEQPAPP
jgi:hypothetical protein